EPTTQTLCFFAINGDSSYKIAARARIASINPSYVYCAMRLLPLLREKKARIGIMGMGYVGLPLAVEFCRKGFSVTGFDVDAGRVGRLKKGRSYILDVESKELAGLVRSKRFAATSDFSGLSRCDAVLICVQTPLRKTKEPDVANIVSA